MSHHFDSELAQADGRLDLCDLYVFAGEQAGHTALILTMNPFAGVVSPITFHPQARYEFKLDRDDDAVEELVLRITFSPVDERGQQRMELRRVGCVQAGDDVEETLLASGCTGEGIQIAGGGRMWAGLAADPFFGNGDGLDRFNQALSEGRFDARAFDNAQNTFAQRNVTAIVLELPTMQLGAGLMHCWATATLWHPEEAVQVNRIANPLLLHLFFEDEALKTAHNQGQPVEDWQRSGAQIAVRVAQASRLAGAVMDAPAYGERVARMLLPDRLAYQPGQPAGYALAGRNGRRLSDDAMDVALSLFVGAPFSDQVGAAGQSQAAFPYLAAPCQPVVDTQANKRSLP
jgi:hypothetical protein